MGITIFTGHYREADSIAGFMDFYYSLHMNHLASDLLHRGFSTKQLNDAVAKAIKVGESYGMDIRQHFKPVFSGIEKEIVQDCKLSHLGYGLVLMNADLELSVVVDFQVSVLESFLKVLHH